MYQSGDIWYDVELLADQLMMASIHFIMRLLAKVQFFYPKENVFSATKVTRINGSKSQAICMHH